MIVEQAQELAGRFALPSQRGVVLLLMPHSPELFLLHLGLVLRGFVPAIIAWPTSRIDPQKYQRNLLHQLRNLPAEQLITLPRLARNLAGGLPYPAVGCSIENEAAFDQLFPLSAVSDSLEATGPVVRKRSQPEALFLQFSGGTTGAQKAVAVTAAMLYSQLELLGTTLAVGPGDSVVSWLPLYHDMGLIACLWFALWHGLPAVHMAANDWIVNPELLFRFSSQYKATLCWLPNFAFSYLAQQRERMAGPYDLSGVRAWINCSEPVRLRSMNSFAAAFEYWGVQREALQSCYAMAETVFAITQSKLGELPPAVPRGTVRPGNCASGNLAFDLVDDVFVSSGHPLCQTEVRIVNSSGSVCPELTPGEIQVRTPSLFGGYWGQDGFTKTSLTEDGWHATGDYGFIANRELFVIGRLKDLIIVGGQNVFPEDVEAVVNSLSAVYAGRVVAFGLDDQEYGTQALAVIAEMRQYSSEAAIELEREIRQLVVAAIGIAPRYVAAVPQRWIVKSTAGKISRRETRERFLAERFSAVTTGVN
jgi:acyl-CoA synthetase (AMP-forming)/AMP-acid ligase II